MTLDDINRLCCREEGPPDAIYLPKADIDALLLEVWDMMWPKPPSPPTYKPGAAITAHGIPICLAEPMT